MEHCSYEKLIAKYEISVWSLLKIVKGSVPLKWCATERPLKVQPQGRVELWYNCKTRNFLQHLFFSHFALTAASTKLEYIQMYSFCIKFSDATEAESSEFENKWEIFKN